MKSRASGWNPLTLAVLAATWIATLSNWPLWRALAALPEMGTARGAIFIVGFCVMVAALTTALLAIAAWRWTIKPVIAIFLISAALGAHFMGSYGAIIDSTMMTNVVQTDPREVRDLLNWRLAASVLVLAVLPMLLLLRMRVSSPGGWRQLGRNTLVFFGGFGVLAVLVFALFADLSATMRNHKTLRYLINPVNSFYALGELAFPGRDAIKGPLVTIGADARVAPRPAGAKPPLLALVVGETGRADHFSLNGYARLTNPELAKLGVVSYTDVTSCGTATAASLPCMFSHLGKQGFESRDRDFENLLDLAQRAGLAVLWLDNQSGCKGLCDRVPNANAGGAAPGGGTPPAALCSAGECLDEALLANLDARIAALPADRRARGVLLVLHQMGSHGPAYYKRSPADRKPFLPECTTNVLQQCSPEALINAYDNSIAYTDHVLAETVKWLETQEANYDPALLYVSDHGESLGENNIYLHGLPYAIAPREQKHVPMIAWLPAQTEAASRVTSACLSRQRDAKLSHDNLFSTVLGLLRVQAAEYKPALDAFAACRSN
ncbi:phosphoethanolamine--lipid A transferase [soil metagenome]